MRLLLNLLFVAFILQSCIGGVSEKKSKLDNYYEQRQKSFDILFLIEKLIGPSGGSWSSLSDIRQIDWKAKDIQTPDPIYESPYSRVGEVYITMDSMFTDFKNEERKVPVKWRVILSGPRMGYNYLILQNGIVSESFSGFSDFFKQKKVLIEEHDYKCYPGSSDCYYRNMMLLINEQKYTVIEKNEFALTGGPSNNFTYYIMPGWHDKLGVLPEKERPKKLEETTVGNN